MLFCKYRWFYLLVCCCWRAKMVRHGTIMCVIVHHAIFSMWMAKSTHLWQIFLLNFVVCCVGSLLGLPLCWCVIGVQRVGIWDVLNKISIGKWFCLLYVHLSRPRLLRSECKISLSIYFMVIHIWSKIWRIVIRQLTMGLPFASNLLVLLLWNQSVH